MTLSQVSPPDVMDGQHIRRPLQRTVDVVIVGSGPGGAPAAATQARAGM